MGDMTDQLILCDAGVCSEGPPGKPFEWNGKKMLAAALLAQ
jgi:hypothetical protein